MTKPPHRHHQQVLLTYTTHTCALLLTLVGLLFGLEACTCVCVGISRFTRKRESVTLFLPCVVWPLILHNNRRALLLLFPSDFAVKAKVQKSVCCMLHLEPAFLKQRAVSILQRQPLRTFPLSKQKLLARGKKVKLYLHDKLAIFTRGEQQRVLHTLSFTVCSSSSWALPSS